MDIATYVHMHVKVVTLSYVHLETRTENMHLFYVNGVAKIKLQNHTNFLPFVQLNIVNLFLIIYTVAESALLVTPLPLVFF